MPESAMAGLLCKNNSRALLVVLTHGTMTGTSYTPKLETPPRRQFNVEVSKECSSMCRIASGKMSENLIMIFLTGPGTSMSSSPSNGADVRTGVAGGTSEAIWEMLTSLLFKFFDWSSAHMRPPCHRL